MALKLLQAPTSEPIDLTEVKSYLRVDISDDDALVSALITAAREYAESNTFRALMPQTYRYTLDKFPENNGTIYIPVPPFQSITSFTYVDIDGVSQTMTENVDYILDSDAEPARLSPAPNTNWATTQKRENAVTITFTAGYPDVNSVPESIKLAIKMMVSHWYENRDIMIDGRLSDTPLAIDAMLGSHRVWRFV